MGFEQKLRDKIAAAKFGSTEKNILKVVLGDFQLKSSASPASDEVGISIVKKLIKGNEETLGHMKSDDSRKPVYEEENRILSVLLPAYLTEDEVKQYLTGMVDEIRAAKSEGQAIGLSSKYLKTLDKPFENETVKKVVVSVRSGS